MKSGQRYINETNEIHGSTWAVRILLPSSVDRLGISILQTVLAFYFMDLPEWGHFRWACHLLQCPF